MGQVQKITLCGKLYIQNNLSHGFLTMDLSGFGKTNQQTTIVAKREINIGMTTKAPLNCEINPVRNGQRAPPDEPPEVMIVKVTT